MNNKEKIIFIHANGFPAGAYKSLFEKLNTDFKIKNFPLRPINDRIDTIRKLRNWTYFSEEFLKILTDENKIIGMGHSIGGNIILRSAIEKPQYFSKIILLDPTLFTPPIIYLWKVSAFLKVQEILYPWLKASLNRKMVYNNFEEIFNSYKNKDVFKLINDENLNIYIKSITELMDNKKLKINFSNLWEHQIYKTGLFADMYIWKNLKKMNVPTLILKAEESTAFSNSTVNKIKKMNSKNIKIKTIKNSSHLFPLEFPQLTSEEIIKFI